MASNGEVVKSKAVFFANDPAEEDRALVLPENVAVKCCFFLPVLADLSDDDNLKNDFTSFLFAFKGATTATMTLQKVESGSYSDIEVLTDDSFGQNYPFGFEEIDGKKLVGYRIDWRLVLAVHGSGTYRLKTEISTLFGGAKELFSFEFCLKPYTAINADETVRLEFYNNNLIGDWEDPCNIKNFGSLNWVNQMRFPKSIFGREVSTYETEEVRYSNGVLVDFQNDQTPEFELELGGLPYYVHKFIKTEIIQSDKILVTDYNSTNPAGIFIESDVKHLGDYSPNWNGNAQEPSVVLAFKPRKNNLRKKLC